MNVQEFTEEYVRQSDNELLCLWAERDTLVPEAVLALDTEIERRGLKKENAARVKKRFDAIAARQGPLTDQVSAAKYERNMRHFVGAEEPSYESPYSRRDIRGTFGYFRHKYRVWQAFREHTGHWPALSICYHFLSWIAVFILLVAALAWMLAQGWGRGWTDLTAIFCFLALLGAREVGARLMRKLDWKRCGPQISSANSRSPVSPPDRPA